MFELSGRTFEPAYLGLYASGMLRERVEQAKAQLASCRVCPRNCRVNRLEDKFAVCKTGRYAVTSSHFPHFGEEDCLRGKRGSGTIFFSGCNLRCVFCQNYDISWELRGRPVRPEQLAGMMLDLQGQGCHNINFVTPEHVVPQIVEALPFAIERGLKLPLIYNTSGYDSMESLQLLDGLVDIYMPDFKWWDREAARKYSKAPDYPEVARRSLKEMHRRWAIWFWMRRAWRSGACWFGIWSCLAGSPEHAMFSNGSRGNFLLIPTSILWHSITRRVKSINGSMRKSTGLSGLRNSSKPSTMCGARG